MLGGVCGVPLATLTGLALGESLGELLAAPALFSIGSHDLAISLSVSESDCDVAIERKVGELWPSWPAQT
jgi:hypothetical protein